MKNERKLNNYIGDFITKVQELGIFTVAVHVETKEGDIISTGNGDPLYSSRVSASFFKHAYSLNEQNFKKRK